MLFRVVERPSMDTQPRTNWQKEQVEGGAGLNALNLEMIQTRLGVHRGSYQVSSLSTGLELGPLWLSITVSSFSL